MIALLDFDGYIAWTSLQAFANRLSSVSSGYRMRTVDARRLEKDAQCFNIHSVAFGLNSMMGCWKVLDGWGISREETAYINRQQRTTGHGCKNNLWPIALVKAIFVKYDFPGILREFFGSPEGKDLSILSINTAGGLSAILESLENPTAFAIECQRSN